MLVRQLLRLLSSAVVFGSVLFGVTSSPAGALGASVCGGEVNVLVDARLATDGSAPSSVDVAVPSSLAPGVYDLRVKTIGTEPEDAVNPQQQVVVVGPGGTLGPTPDVADGVGRAFVIVSVGQVSLDGTTSSISVVHAGDPATGANPVRVRCVGFTPIAPSIVVDLTAVPRTDCLTGEVVVDLTNAGDTGTATVSVGADVRQVVVDAGQTARTVHPLDDGTYPVTVAIHDTVVFDDTVVFSCGGDGGIGGDGPGSGGDTPGDGDGDGDGPGSGDGPGDGSTGGGDDGSGSDDGSGGGDGSTDGGDGSGSGDGSNGGGTGGDGSTGGTGSTDGSTGGTGQPAATPGDTLPPLGPESAASLDLRIRLECTSGSVAATVVNSGDLAGTATLALARSTTTTSLAVDAGASSQVRFDLPETFEGAEAEVVLVTDDGTVVSRSLAVDCLADAAPVVDVVVDCAARELHVVVVNEGEEGADVRIFEESVALLSEGTIAGGEQRRSTIPIDAAEIAVRVVTVGGDDLFRDSVTPGCVEEDVIVTHSLACPSQEVELRLENLADSDRVAIVEVDGSSRLVELGPGAVMTVARPVDGSLDLVVTSIFGDVLLDESIEPWTCGDFVDPATGCVDGQVPDDWRVVAGEPDACDDVRVRLVLDCLASTTVVEILNGTPDRVRVQAEVDGTEAGVRAIAAAQREDWRLAADPRSRVVVRQLEPDLVLLDARVGCTDDADRTGAVLGGLLVVLMSLVAAVVARFDPWLRV